jgi:phage regulator Rha-like protein
MANEDGNDLAAGANTALIAVEQVERRIYTVRGQNVMLDSDLAELYGVETKNLNKAVQRNGSRFPVDFMFRLTLEETESLRFQIGTSNEGRGGRRYLPYAFTEQGVAMLSSVLRSERAVQVNIAIMRAFVSLRGLLTQDSDLARRILTLEQKYDEQFAVVFEAIRLMLEAPPATERRMGFRAREEETP